MRDVPRTSDVQARAYREMDRIESVSVALMVLCGAPCFVAILTEPIWSESVEALIRQFVAAVGMTFILLCVIALTSYVMTRRVARRAGLE